MRGRSVWSAGLVALASLTAGSSHPSVSSLPSPKVFPAEERFSLNIVWPAPPAPPRIKYLYSLQRFQDVKFRRDSWTKRLYEGILGRSEFKGSLLATPYGVCYQDEQVFVADTRGLMAVVFDRMYENVYGLGGTLHGRFITAIDVAVNESGTVYVSDSTLGVVKVFAPGKNEFLYEFGSGDEIKRPTGMFYDILRRHLLVVDTKGHAILVYNSDGKLLFKFGKSGVNDGEFAMPINVTADRQGRIYVVDSFLFRVQVFSPEGKFLWKFGEQGDMAGFFARPRGIAVDSDGNIYVSDALLNVVQLFDQKGRILMWFGATGSIPGAFQLPAGLFIDEYDRIYVSDSLNGRVQVFQYLKDKKDIEANLARRKAGLTGRMDIAVVPSAEAIARVRAAGEWEIKIQDDTGRVLKTVAGSGMPPSTLDWDGADERGIPIMDISRVKKILTVKGAEVEAGTIDAVGVEPQLALVRGGAAYSEVVLSMPRGEYQCWQCQIVDRDKVIADWAGDGRPPEKIRWSGKDKSGSRVKLEAAVCSWQFQGANGVWSVGERAVPKVDAMIERGEGFDRVRLIGAAFTGTNAELAERHWFMLAKAASLVRRHPDNTLRIESYASAGEGDAADTDLAQARGGGVVEALTDRFGVAADRIALSVHAASEPAPEYPGMTGDRAKQRVDIVLEMQR